MLSWKTCMLFSSIRVCN